MKDLAKPLAVWVIVACLLVGMSLAGGCSLDEIVKVDVPPNTREHYREALGVNVPGRVPLRDARILRSEGDRKLEANLKAQLADHAASNDALDAEIEDGAFIESLLGSAINTGIDTAVPGLSAVPGGAILTTLLAGFGMWLAPRPGDGKRIAEKTKAAEDRGYDMGQKEAAELLKRGVSS